VAATAARFRGGGLRGGVAAAGSAGAAAAATAGVVKYIRTEISGFEFGGFE